MIFLKELSENEASCKIAELATKSLFEELKLYPKPGLVSYVDTGSHSDMDFATFESAIKALHSYWQQMAIAGMNGSGFAFLNKLGIEAEKKMLYATNFVNTHRGAIFILGIMVSAVGYALKTNLGIVQIPQIIRDKWGADIIRHKLKSNSHGSFVRRQFPEKVTILDMASEGFVNIIHEYLMLIIEFYPEYLEMAYLQTFFTILSQTEDTNLLYRGGTEALSWAQAQAYQFLADGGIAQNSAIEKAENIHRRFIDRNLSPGGCADILSATIFVYEVQKELWG